MSSIWITMDDDGTDDTAAHREMPRNEDGVFRSAVRDYLALDLHMQPGECREYRLVTEDEADTKNEVASVLQMLDELAELWGDEGKFRACRDRLRKLV